jgi:hypothetical protein
MSRTIFLLVFLGFALVADAAAQKPFAVENFEARPLPDARENYFDLIEKITGGEVSRAGAPRNLPLVNESFELRRLVVGEGDDETTGYQAPLVVQDAEGWWFEANGEKHLALLLEVADGDSGSLYGQSVLAVFRVRPAAIRGALKSLELTDAVDPQADRFVGFPDEFPLVETRAKNQAFWILNQHWNAGENFSNYQLVHVERTKDRLSLALENLPGVYTSADCSDDTEDRFRVERLNRQPGNYLPYNFIFETFRWTKKQCLQRAATSYPIYERRIYRAAWTFKNKRRVLRLRLIKFSKKRTKFVVAQTKNSPNVESEK